MAIAITLTVIACVVLTVAMVAISRAGGRDHQENLSGHSPEPTRTPAGEGQGPVPEPKADRPAGPDAEAMGSEPGRPTLDADTERRG